MAVGYREVDPCVMSVVVAKNGAHTFVTHSSFADASTSIHKITNDSSTEHDFRTVMALCPFQLDMGIMQDIHLNKE